MIQNPFPADVLTAAREGSADADGPIVFVHVPKCAGSTFTAFLHARFRRPFEFPWNDLDAGLDRFLAARPDDHDVAFGHLEWRHVERLIEHPRPFRFVTFLRDPVARAISNYRYCRSERHPTHERFRANVPDMDAYVRQSRGMWADFVARTVVGPVTDADSALAALDRTYAFVGITEWFDLSLWVFCQRFGVPFAAPRERLNTAAGRAPDRVTITDEHRAAIAAGNAIDTPLYERVRARYRDAAPELFAELARTTARRPKFPWLGRHRRDG